MAQKARMTPAERIQALYERKPVDRVPFIHRGYAFCARNVGYPIADIYEHPVRSFEAQVWTAEQYRSDGTPFYTFSAYGAWEFGGEIKWPDDRWGAGPSVARRPVGKPEDLWTLEVPEPKTAGCVPKMLEFAKIQEEHGVPISFICGSPFSHAANLCGVDTFLQWLIEIPEAVHRALRLVTDHILSVAQLFIQTFGKGRVLARSAATVESLISPRHFEEFALPYLQELHQKVLSMGARSIYCHICGEQNHNLSLWAQVPFGNPGMLSFGHEVDLLVAAKYFPDHIIAGNVDPRLVSRGTPAQVYEACRETIEKGKRIPAGFVFMGGCEIPVSTPPYNVYLMSKAAEEFGWY
ncbi:MAG: uroporphyrinogen decarboxylase family protein [Anaerolineae bacterium]